MRRGGGCLCGIAFPAVAVPGNGHEISLATVADPASPEDDSIVGLPCIVARQFPRWPGHERR